MTDSQRKAGGLIAAIFAGTALAAMLLLAYKFGVLQGHMDCTLEKMEQQIQKQSKQK